MILLDCTPSSSLDWNMEKFPKEGPLFFYFDLGLEAPYFPIDDEMRFQSLSLALNKFTSEIYPRFQDRISGAVLYRGSADFSSHFLWTDKQMENFELWKRERPPSNETHWRRLFTADAFVHYFQMLSHRLPDELPLYLLLDAKGTGTLAERHHLFSKERFEHFLVATKDLAHTCGLIWEGEKIEESKEKAKSALCLPMDAACSENVLKTIDEKMGILKTPYRVISEAHLTEQWDGVDELYVLENVLTSQGLRKIKGFLAAGGKVIGWS